MQPFYFIQMEEKTMSKILELREKRAKAWDAAKQFLDAKRGADGMLSEEDTATYDKMEQDVMNLGKEIERLERQAAIDAELSRATSTPLTGKPGAKMGKDEKEKTGRASDEYKYSFWNAMRVKAPMPSVLNALQEGTDSEGGYLVPDEFERTLVEALEEENVFRTLAHVIRTSSGDRKIPVVASKGSASWVDEEGAYQESDDAFSQVSIGAYKLGTMIKVSEELLADSVFDLEAYISKEFARRIGSREEESFFNGDGKGKPLGILAATGEDFCIHAYCGSRCKDDRIRRFQVLLDCRPSGQNLQEAFRAFCSYRSGGIYGNPESGW